jgi:hypothetical protein
VSDLALDVVDPPMGPRTTPTPVQLRGAFPLAIISDLDRGDTRVSDELVVTVGGK